MAHSLDLDELTRRRERAGLTIPELAKRAGLPERTVRYVFSGRGATADTLTKLHAALVGVHESPLVRVVTPAEVQAQNEAGQRAMVAPNERRQALAKAASDPAYAEQYAEVQRIRMRKRAEGLDELAATISKGSDFTPEQVKDQLFAAEPALIDAYAEIENERLQRANAEAISKAEERTRRQELAGGRRPIILSSSSHSRTRALRRKSSDALWLRV